MGRLWLVLIASALACGADDEATSSESGATASDSTGSTGSASVASDDAATSASTGSITSADGTSAGSDGAVSTSAADDGPVTGDGDECATMGAGTCDFEATVCAIAEESIRPAEDCGFVTLADTAATWQAAHACAFDALQSENPFKVLWQPMGIDSSSYSALVGVVAESYEITFVGYDDYQGRIALYSYPVYDVEADCTASVGSMCLHILDGGDTTSICP